MDTTRAYVRHRREKDEAQNGTVLTAGSVSGSLPFVATYGNAVLTALGDPTRQSIVECLASGPLAVTDLAARLPVSRPAVSQHLKVLAEAGVVGHRAVGTRRVYHLDPAGLAALRSYLDGFWTQALTSFADLAEATSSTPPPSQEDS
ncbi:MAG TPA: metalloregulator ArsR/SmtB family transcription factor [Kineosporiaceae bacterium]|nr:metalloregulator ArsR/SmtB family transcription factor [Kineosporiaceae bacterium]